MKTRKRKPMAVYWINLERSKERNQKMLELVKDPAFDGMKKQRVEAYDGGDPKVEKKIRTMIPIIPWTKKVTMKEYACLLSHLKTILLFSKSNYDYALVLEDDASLEYKPYWKTTFKECINGAPHDWEILQFCFFGKTLPRQLYSPKHHYSTTAYVISKKGAKNLMKMYQSNYFNLDPTLHPTADFYLYQALKTYTYKYPFFTFDNKDTTIFNEKELSGRDKSKQTLKKLLMH